MGHFTGENHVKIAMLCGGFPPDFDAIGEYTEHLSKALAQKNHPVTVFTTQRPPALTSEGVEVVGVFDPANPASLQNLVAALSPAAEAAAFDWLVVQYNPFAFGRRGYCPQLAETLAQIKRLGQTRVAIVFHETCVPKWPLRLFIMWTWQHSLFASVCRTADRIFVSTERWTPQVHWVRPRATCIHLPVGSNIPASELTQSQAREQLGIEPEARVLGVFGNAHPSRLLDWIGDAARATQQVVPQFRVLYVGKDGAVFRKACAGVNFDDRGLLDGAGVSNCLAAMEALGSPFIDGISTRRGSAIASLQQGCPVLTTRRKWSDPLIIQNPLVHSSNVAEGSVGYSALVKTFFTDRPPLPKFDFEASPFSWNSISLKLLNSLIEK